MVVLKRNTPNVEPWGQPPFTSLGLERVLPILTDMVLIVKKVAMSLMMSVEAPFFSRAFRQC